MLRKILILLLVCLIFQPGFALGAVGDDCDCNQTAEGCPDCDDGEVCICDPDPGDGKAEGTCREKCTGICFENPLQSCTLDQLIQTVINFLFAVGSVIAIGVVLYSAFLFLTSGGSAEKISQAKKALLYAVIGFVIILSIKVIGSIIRYLIGF